ncbi:hypothetical protein WA026_010821 [Henosepilachna vigintioctopunctata]|uniref:Uncharacterized protein n=1 Tax=Henosepilachna vigintioctopunctata TaxID=420089 RepID=A0AAW1UWP5_9CUCU
MNEMDMQLARAIVAEEKQRSASSTPGGSPTPLRKSVIAQVMDRTNKFSLYLVKTLYKLQIFIGPGSSVGRALDF